MYFLFFFKKTDGPYAKYLCWSSERHVIQTYTALQLCCVHFQFHSSSWRLYHQFFDRSFLVSLLLFFSPSVISFFLTSFAFLLFVVFFTWFYGVIPHILLCWPTEIFAFVTAILLFFHSKQQEENAKKCQNKTKIHITCHYFSGYAFNIFRLLHIILC